MQFYLFVVTIECITVKAYIVEILDDYNWIAVFLALAYQTFSEVCCVLISQLPEVPNLLSLDKSPFNSLYELN